MSGNKNIPTLHLPFFRTKQGGLDDSQGSYTFQDQEPQQQFKEPLLASNKPQEDELRPCLDPKKEDTHKNSLCIGAVFMLMAALCSSGMKFLVKSVYTQTSLNSFELGYWRGLVGLLINVLYVYCHGIHIFSIPRSSVKFLMLRGFVGFLGLGCAFTALRFLSISSATVVFFTNPFFTSVLAAFVLKESFKIYDFFALLAGLAGVFLLFRPSFVPTPGYDSRERALGVGLGLLGALCAGLAYTASRRVLSKTHFTIPSLLFCSFSAMFMPLLSTAQRSFYPPREEPTGGIILMLVGVGVLGFCVQMFLSLALKFERTGRATVLWYAQILFIYLLDVFYFHTTFLWTDILGATLIIGANLVVILLKFVLTTRPL